MDFESAIDTIILPSDRYKFMFVSLGIPKEKIKVLGFLNFEMNFQLQRYEDNLKPERNWNKIFEVI